MKKNKIKIMLIVFIMLIALVLCFNVVVYATYVLTAKDVNYIKSEGSTISLKEALDELYTTQSLAKVVSVGDYVAYDPGIHSYTSPIGTGSSHGNGNGEQTYTSSSSLKWRVLGWDEETGGLKLISEAPIENFTMFGAIGYLYAEQELNEICKIYGYGVGANTSKKFNYVIGDNIEGTTVGTITGSGARSINVDDVNKICGVIPSLALNSEYGKALHAPLIYYPTTRQERGYSNSSSNRTYVNTFYQYRASNYLSNITELYKILFRNTGDSKNIEYWLASSRSIAINSSFSTFCVRYVNDDNGEVDGAALGYTWDTNFFGYVTSYGVRPIVYLKSTIQTNGKNYDGEWNIIDK